MARYIKFVDALNKVVRVILVGMFIVMFLTCVSASDYSAI